MIHQEDPFTRGRMQALEHALTESEMKRYELEARVSDLNRQIERLTGFGPDYVRDTTERFDAQIRDSRKSLVEAKREHAQQVEELEARIRGELDRYVKAKELADTTSTAAERLKAIHDGLSDEMIRIVRGAMEDKNPLILKPTVYGMGLDLMKAFRWVRGKFVGGAKAR